MKRAIISLTAFIFIFFFSNSPVSAKVVNINFSSTETYGTANFYFGIKIPASLDDGLTQTLINFMGNKNLYLKLIDATESLVSNPNFQSLSSKGFRWYFTFTSNNKASNFLKSAHNQLPSGTVVELTNYDPAFVNSLKNQYPQVNIHAAQFFFWPRDQVQNIVEQTPPPTVEAISLYTEHNNIKGNLYDTIKLMFDTFFDACSDVPGTSGIKINYPANSRLSLSDIRINDSDSSKALAYTTGVVSSAIVAAVQTQNRNKKAPFKYIFGGNFYPNSSQAQTVFNHIANFAYQNPQVVWPMAIASNGGPYDLYDNSTIAGVIAIKNSQYYFILTNTAATSTTVNFSQTINASLYQSYSNQKGANFISGAINQIVFSPYETIVISPSGSVIPTMPANISPSPPLITSPQLYPTTLSPTKTLFPSPSPSPSDSLVYPTDEISSPAPTKPEEPEEGNKGFIIPKLSEEYNQQPTPVNFLITINNPYEPYRQIQMGRFRVENQETPIHTGENLFSLVLTNQPTVFTLEIVTSDGYRFKKSGSVNFNKENKITLTLAHPLFLVFKNMSDFLVDKITLVGQIFEFLDQPFRKATPF